MKRIRLLAILLVLLPVLAYSAGQYRPTGYEAITVDNTGGGKYLTVAKYYNATTGKTISDLAVITVESASIRYTDDGTTVTSSAGTPVLPYGEIVLGSFSALQNFRAIRTGDVSASIKVRYYKYYDQR